MLYQRRNCFGQTVPGESHMDSELVGLEDFVATYDGGQYVDAMEAIEDYGRVMRHHQVNPDMGSSALAGRLEIPRGRIRPWLEGGAPDPVRGLETARDHGWVGVSFSDACFGPLNVLVAGVFSGGSIAEQYYQPRWAVDDRGRESGIRDALTELGVGYRVDADRDGRADEIVPASDAVVLGRVLSVLGAPVGPKAEQRLSLPDYLDRAPNSIRDQFVDVYLANRAIEPHNDVVRFREERSDAYLSELAGLIEDVADAPVTITEKNVTLSVPATEAVGY